MWVISGSVEELPAPSVKVSMELEILLFFLENFVFRGKFVVGLSCGFVTRKKTVLRERTSKTIENSNKHGGFPKILSMKENRLSCVLNTHKF